MIDGNKILQAVASLRGMGIEIGSFHCTPEVLAEIDSLGLTVARVQTGNTAWMEHAPDDGLGRGVGSRHFRTLCGIPLEQRR